MSDRHYRPDGPVKSDEQLLKEYRDLVQEFLDGWHYWNGGGTIAVAAKKAVNLGFKPTDKAKPKIHETDAD